MNKSCHSSKTTRDDEPGTSASVHDKVKCRKGKLALVNNSSLPRILNESLRNGHSSFLLTLLPGNELTLSGSYNLCVRQGVVSIAEAVLTPSLNVHRALGLSRDDVTTIRHLQSPSGHVMQSAKIYLSSELPGSRKLSHLKRAIRSTGCDRTGCISSFRAADSSRDRPDPVEWTALCNALASNPSPSPVLVSGARGSGYSHFSRGLVNRLLTTAANGSGLAFLELDLTLPLLGLPGKISLAHLQAPLLGFLSPELDLPRQFGGAILRAHFVGTQMEAHGASHLYECVTNLYEQYCKTLRPLGCPLVINGIGVSDDSDSSTLFHFIRPLEPQIVVYCIQSHSPGIVQALEDHTGKLHAKLHLIPPDQASLRKNYPSRPLKVRVPLYFQISGPDQYYSNRDPRKLRLKRVLNLNYGGSSQQVHGILIFGNGRDYGNLVDIIRGAILTLVAIEEPSETSENNAAQVNHNLDIMPSTKVQPAASSITSCSTLSLLYQSTKGRVRPHYPDIRVIHTAEGLPYAYNGPIVNSPLDPKVSHCIGHAIVKDVDETSQVIQIITPVSQRILLGLWETGARLILVKESAELSDLFYREQISDTSDGIHAQFYEMKATNLTTFEGKSTAPAKIKSSRAELSIGGLSSADKCRKSANVSRKDRIWKTRRNI